VSHALLSSKGHPDITIGRGYVCFVGFSTDDSIDTLTPVARKLVNLRLVPDKFGKINLSLTDIYGEFLLISQFTLYGNLSRGYRPDFSQSAKTSAADVLFRTFVEIVRSATSLNVKSGIFKSNMDVTLTNTGPVTVMLEG